MYKDDRPRPLRTVTASDDADRLQLCLWRHLLVYPPLVRAICDLARAWIDPTRRSHAALTRLLDPGPLRVARPSREQLCIALAAVDPSGALLDAIVADLLSLDAGVTTGLNLHLEHPPPISPAFRRYTAGARSRYHALWAAREAC